MTPPTVSVVIPYFNRLEQIAKTLRILMCQTFEDWEVVVVDDCSNADPTSNIEEIVPAPRSQVIRLDRNAGPSTARNVGIRASRGRFVAFLDSDDEWLPNKLEKQVAAVLASADPDRIFCYSKTKIVGSPTSHSVQPNRGILPGENPADYLFLENGFAQTSSFFVGRGAAIAIGFDEELRQYEDFRFFMSAQDHVESYLFLDDPLTVWNNEDQADRLSRGANKSIANARKLIAKAGTVFGHRARLRFLMTHVGVDIIQQNVFSGFALATQAVLVRAVTPRYALRQILRAVLSDGIYSRLRATEEHATN